MVLREYRLCMGFNWKYRIDDVHVMLGSKSGWKSRFPLKDGRNTVRLEDNVRELPQCVCRTISLGRGE